MDKKPLVTIITITKNRSNLISRCIESIQNQTYDNYEHIIADGGDDDTEEKVASYNDSHIKYIRVPKGGQIAQTKRAFDISKGDYITFLDDDDEYCPDKIEKQLNLITTLPDNYGFIYGAMSYYDNTTKQYIKTHEAPVSGENLLEVAVERPIISGTPTLMFKRKVFEEIGGTWISGIGNDMSDWALICKTLEKGWNVGALKESLVRVYINHGSQRMSDSKLSIAFAERYILFHSYFLSRYEDIFKKYPHKSIFHIENMFVLNMIAKHRMRSLKYWTQLLLLRPNFRTFALLPMYTIKSFKSK